MEPFWVDVDKVPFDRMWLDDEHWFPHFMAGKTFRGEFVFEQHGTAPLPPPLWWMLDNAVTAQG